ncbi:MAG TPA: efflux transporter outer membrane subunit [Rhodocyclaceae bacterium]|nr:efflux transporter outer membrane subunit [Rhodocyclaceae bacterium]
MNANRFLPLLLAAAALAGCKAGPDYVRPSINMPAAFKEDTGWKTAEPRDNLARGNWWEIYGDATLNGLVEQVAVSNQNIQVALAQYRQARAVAQEARAGYFPTLDANVSVSRNYSAAQNRSSPYSNTHALTLDASWEPDLWGSVARDVESRNASVQAQEALVASAKLSAQAELVQDYFQLRTSDATLVLEQNTVDAYRRSLRLTQNQLAAGIITKADVAQAQTQLLNAQAQLVDLGVQRAQLEHAIAILIGKAPADFTLAPAPLTATLPPPPLAVPSTLLERRPDIAASERQAAAANANIGVEKAAYFPALNLSASGGYQNAKLADWFSAPSRVWSLGAALAQTIFDGGLRKSRTDAAIASFDAAAAQYRQTVLGALQEVEDNLAALRILSDEADVQRDVITAAQEAERLALNQYKSGLVSYLNVVTAQTAANASERAALQIQGSRYSASVLLIKALGGGWEGLQGNTASAETGSPAQR